MSSSSTLTRYVPQVGDLVWLQMYDPQAPTPEATIEERVAHGQTYGQRRQMIVRGITPDYDSTAYSRSLGLDVAPRLVTRWTLQDPDPQRRRDECRGYSWVESDWSVLEPVNPTEDGRLW